jgi:hypothetical protein
MEVAGLQAVGVDWKGRGGRTGSVSVPTRTQEWVRREEVGARFADTKKAKRNCQNRRFRLASNRPTSRRGAVSGSPATDVSCCSDNTHAIVVVGDTQPHHAAGDRACVVSTAMRGDAPPSRDTWHILGNRWSVGAEILFARYARRRRRVYHLRVFASCRSNASQPCPTRVLPRAHH